MLIRDHHGSGPEWLGLCAASQAIGSLAAATVLASRSLGKRSGARLTALCLVICAMSLTAMVVVESRPLLLPAFGIYGAGIAAFNVLVQSAIQARTPSALRGRVISASTAFVAGVMPVSAAITGLAIDSIDQNVPIVWGATAAIFVVCAISLATSRAAREYLATG